MPNYRYSRLQNDLDDDEEEGLQQPSALESSSPKDSYRIRHFIACGIILMIVVALLVLYHGKIGRLFCQMVCIFLKK